MNAFSNTGSAGSPSGAVGVPGLDALVTLIGLEVELARAGAGLNPEDRAVLDRLTTVIGGLGPGERPVPANHPAVQRWLDPAVSRTPEQRRPLADAFRSVAPHLVWKTAYAGAPTSPTMRHFWTNYAFAPLASPDLEGAGENPLRSDEMNLYLVVQGAGVEYGRHHHPAIEVYGIISGTARWLRGDDGFQTRGPGDVFVHHPDMMHATTTSAEPVISWVAWLGDLESSPLLLTPGGPAVKA